MADVEAIQLGAEAKAIREFLDRGLDNPDFQIQLTPYLLVPVEQANATDWLTAYSRSCDAYDKSGPIRG
jgi:hypothetical protein